MDCRAGAPDPAHPRGKRSVTEDKPDKPDNVPDLSCPASEEPGRTGHTPLGVSMSGPAEGAPTLEGSPQRKDRSLQKLRRSKSIMIQREARRPARERSAKELIAAFLAAGIPVTYKNRIPSRPLCGATTRNGAPCRCYALRNGRCRLHGGLSTGPRTAEGGERTRAGYRAWVERERSRRRGESG